MNDIVAFSFDQAQIRTITDADGEPWFVARDIATALGYADTVKAVSTHCKKAKSLIDMGAANRPPKQNQVLTLDPQTKLIPESDVYRLTMRSALDSAARFQDWLVEEVLPQIRKTGAYAANLTPAQMFAESARLFLEQEKRVLALEANQARQNQRIEAVEAKQQAITEGFSYFTVLAYAKLHSLNVDLSLASKLGKQASLLSREEGVLIDRVRDPRFGQVNAYQEAILDRVFGAALADCD